VTIHQDVALYSAILDAGQPLPFEIPAGRHAWLQVARGSLTLYEARNDPDDGAAISSVDRLSIMALEGSEILLFDLA
jgi:hypothetical protein